MLHHSSGQFHTTDLHPTIFKIPCHMPRSTPQVADHALVSDTFGKRIEQLPVKGLAGEFREERLCVLLGDVIIAGFDSPGVQGHRENSHVLCRSNQQPLIKPKQLIVLFDELGEKVQTIRLFPPGIPEVQQCEFSHPCYVLW